MAFNLLSLLGQQIMPHGTYDEGIDVIGNRPQTQQSTPVLPEFAGASVPELPQEPLPPNMLSREQLRDMAPYGNLPEHKGIFGAKGTLRDIIGVLGDAFLINSGAKPIYGPKRQQEKLSDAMAGLQENAHNAIARTVQQDPEAGFKLFQEVADQDYKSDSLRSMDQSREVLNAQRQQKVLFDARNVAARLLGAADGDPQKTAFVLQQINGLADRLGLDPEEDLGISELMTPEQAALYADSDMTVNQQQRLPLERQRVGISQQNADTARISATRPRAGKTPVDRDVYIDLKNRDPDELSAGQQAWIKRYEEGTGGKKGRIGNGVPPPPKTGGGRPLRIISTRPSN